MVKRKERWEKKNGKSGNQCTIRKASFSQNKWTEWDKSKGWEVCGFKENMKTLAEET